MTRKQFTEQIIQCLEDFNIRYELAEQEYPEEFPSEQSKNKWWDEFTIYMDAEL